MITLHLTVGAIIGIIAMIIGIIACKKLEEDERLSDLSKNPYMVHLSIWCFQYGYVLHIYKYDPYNYAVKICKDAVNISFTLKDSSNEALSEVIFQIIECVLYNEREDQNDKKTLQ